MWCCSFPCDLRGIDDNDKCGAELQLLTPSMSGFQKDWIGIFTFSGHKAADTSSLTFNLKQLLTYSSKERRNEAEDRQPQLDCKANLHAVVWMTDRLFGSHELFIRCIYEIWGAQRPRPARLHQQRLWPVSPSHAASVYEAPPPPLSSGRAVTAGCGQKHKHQFEGFHEHSSLVRYFEGRLMKVKYQKTRAVYDITTQ